MQLRLRTSPKTLAQIVAATLMLAALPGWSTEEADDPEGSIETETEVPQAQTLEKAESIPLDQPVAPAGTNKEESAASVETEKTGETDQETPPAEAARAKPLRLLGAEVPPATSTRLAWSPSQHFEGVYSSTAVLVVNGAEPGPTLCLTAAVHGDELNGIETVRRVLYNLDPDTLKGAVIGVPIVNLQGFHRGSRYLTDRRDLNRHFPGDPNGSSASRIAHSFFHEVISHCNAVVDLHTGSFYRTNLPQLRGDLTNPKVVKLTKGFGSTVVLHSDGAKGTLRRAAVNAGIPTVTLEAGAPMVLDEVSVSHSVKGIRTLLNQLDMVSKFRLWGEPEPVYYNSTWQRATTGGIIFSKVKLGQFVRRGDLLGTVTNPITNVRKEIRSEHNGRILGMALNQVVQPGFAAYHIGIQAPQEQISAPEEVTAETPVAGKDQEDQATAGNEQPADVVTEDGEPAGDEPAVDTPPGGAMPADAGDEPEPEPADPDSEDK
ncbi:MULTISPECIES: succinylglutamate desuccinylase/aspartoacylase family protein [Microbulbifer]|uniref:succinylglutamate desuccinylase/aspartoacylase family protein n=1 Tax=Microbulbifer TaxID=48073 RepID=UPI0009EA0B38|nr:MULTISPECIES: succinylglutamate desuccinylase/aspartoacylase family protein [Microbulbifer]